MWYQPFERRKAKKTPSVHPFTERAGRSLKNRADKPISRVLSGSANAAVLSFI